MKGGLAVSDVIRSMLRLGYGQNQIYEVLICAGVQGEMAQLLIERVSAEIARVTATQKSEFRRGFDEILEMIENLRIELITRINTLVKITIGENEYKAGPKSNPAHGSPHEKRGQHQQR